MISRHEYVAAREEAAAMIRRAGLVVSDAEVEAMDVADFGLGNLRVEGAQILTMLNTSRVSARVLALLPRQTEPEHWHTSAGDDPGKEETVRVVAGTVYFYIPGVENIRFGSIPQHKEFCYTVRHEVVLRPGDQITLEPGTRHWFQAGEDGAVMFSFASNARDAQDPFTDPNVVRATQISD